MVPYPMMRILVVSDVAAFTIHLRADDWLTTLQAVRQSMRDAFFYAVEGSDTRASNRWTFLGFSDSP